jgi:transposase
MKRFIQGENRQQSTLFPELLDDYISEENQIRVIDVFVDSLDLLELGFETATPKETGRPGYHPSVMLKLYIYGYLNRIQTSRRLERETQRNVELMWLMARLTPDFKTIADFRKDNAKGIQNVCKQFIELCRKLSFFTDAVVAIDGSKFKASNNRNRNFTTGKIKAKIERAEASIADYLSDLDKADRLSPENNEHKQSLKDKIAAIKLKVAEFKAMSKKVEDAPSKQVSLTDPDCRSMACKSSARGIVGYNIQSAVDTEHHLIVAHEVTNLGYDKTQFANMAKQASEAIGEPNMTAIADKGYYSGREILTVKEAGMTPLVPKTMTSGNKRKGMFTKNDFDYNAEEDVYQCPAGEKAIYRFTSFESNMNIRKYWSSNCVRCEIKDQCTTSKFRRIGRWEHEHIMEEMAVEVAKNPDLMITSKSTVEHPFGTIKLWMGAVHFNMRTMKNVATEMSLHVLSYNLRRVMNIMGKKRLIEAILA